MTFDIDVIVESKRKYRSELANLPIAEKLRMLDELRDRTLAIRAATPRPSVSQAPTTPSPNGNLPE